MTKLDLKAEGRRLEREAADAAEAELTRLTRVLRRRRPAQPIMFDAHGNPYVESATGWHLTEIKRGRPVVFDFGRVAPGEHRTVVYDPQRVQRFGGPELEVWHHGPLRCFTVTAISFGSELLNRQPIPAVMLRAMWQATSAPSLSTRVPLTITVRNDDARPRSLILAFEPLQLGGP